MIRRFFGALVLLAIPVLARAQVLITPEPYISSSGVVSGALLFPDGAVGAPSSAFTTDTDTGRYLVGAGNLGFSIGGALVFDLEDTNAAGGSANLATISSTLGIMDGSDTFNGFRVELSNVNHTGTGNTINAVSIANITGDADATENAINFGTGFDADIEAAGDLALTVDGLDLGVWKVTVGTLTATQVRTLNATPVEVIAAPGSGKAIVIESAQFMLDYGGTVFDSVAAGEDLFLAYVTAGSGWLLCDETTCLDGGATSDKFGTVRRVSNAGGRSLSDNDAMDIAILVAEWASTDDDSDGNSVIRYIIRYRVVTLDLS